MAETPIQNPDLHFPPTKPSDVENERWAYRMQRKIDKWIIICVDHNNRKVIEVIGPFESEQEALNVQRSFNLRENCELYISYMRPAFSNKVVHDGYESSENED